MAKSHTLYSPNGEKYTTNDATEATRLRMAHGYKDKAPSKAKPDPAPKA